MYCKTKTYINLKRQADRLYRRAMETQNQLDWDAFEDYELETADYGIMYEDEINWNEVESDAGYNQINRKEQ